MFQNIIENRINERINYLIDEIDRLKAKNLEELNIQKNIVK